MDRLDEHIWLDILEEVAERAVLEKFEDVVVAVMDGEGYDLRPRARLFELLRDLESRQPRHVDVEQEDVGLQHKCPREGFLSVLRLADDLEVVLKIQHALDPLAEQRMIVRKKYSNRHLHLLFSLLPANINSHLTRER